MSNPTSKGTKIPNVPNLRFPDFTNPWNLSRLAAYITEIKSYTSDFQRYPLFTFSIENGVTEKTDRYERGFLVKKEGDIFKIIRANQFLLNPMNLRFGAINYSKIKYPVSVSGYYDIFEIDDGSDNEFWHSLLSNKQALKLYHSVATGSLEEKKRVHFSQFVDLEFFLPEKGEREKLSKFLHDVNARIEVQNKIISELISLKNRIRPQPNAQIRFSEITTHHSSTLSLSNVKENGNYSVYGANGLCGYSDNYQFDFPAIAIVKDGAGVGRLIKISNTKYSIIGTMNLLEPRGVSIDYLYLVMHNINFKKYIVGSGIPHIYFGDYKSELVPSPNEQNLRLANLLSLVEKKIANESEVLQQYIRQKGYLLSNLFI